MGATDSLGNPQAFGFPFVSHLTRKVRRKARNPLGVSQGGQPATRPPDRAPSNAVAQKEGKTPYAEYEKQETHPQQTTGRKSKRQVKELGQGFGEYAITTETENTKNRKSTETHPLGDRQANDRRFARYLVPRRVLQHSRI